MKPRERVYGRKPSPRLLVVAVPDTVVDELRDVAPAVQLLDRHLRYGDYDPSPG